MRSATSITLILLLGAGLGLLAGCSGDAAAPTAAAPVGGDDYDALDLNDPWGGLTVSDEDEAFGDESLQAELLAEEGQSVADPLAADPRCGAWSRCAKVPAAPMIRPARGSPTCACAGACCAGPRTPPPSTVRAQRPTGRAASAPTAASWWSSACWPSSVPATT